MSILGHVAVGVVAARATNSAEEGRLVLAGRMVGLASLALAPDIDFILELLAPSSGAAQHRAATHSLLLAAVVGFVAGVVAVAARRGAAASRRGPFAVGVLVFAVVASHGLLDALGRTQLGVELFWPFSDTRVLLPWQVLPNPSVDSGLGRFLVQLAVELLLFLPAWIYAFAPRRLWKRSAGATAGP